MLNKIVNTTPFRAKREKVEFLNNLPAIATEFKSKNMSDLEESSLREVLDRASKDMRDGMVTFRSIRQFRKEAAYKLQPGLDGVLPWRKEAASVSCAFAIIGFMYGNFDGVRMIERLEKKTKFATVGGGTGVYVSPLAPFVNAGAGILATIKKIIDEILDDVPGDGYLITDAFFSLCENLVTTVTSNFGALDASQSATVESMALYKVARVCDVINKVVAATAGTYKSLKNSVASVTKVTLYIDHTNWQNVLTSLWTLHATQAATEILRRGVDILDTDLVNDVYSVGRFVVETNTLKPDAYLKIFEKESAAVMEAIDEFNRYSRHLARVAEVPDYLNMVYAADLLGIKAMNDAEKRLARVVLFSSDETGALSQSFVGIGAMTSSTILDMIDKSEKRLSRVLESLTSMLDAYYEPVMYEPWSGCAITWTDAARTKIIKRVRRYLIRPNSTIIHKINKVEGKIAGIESYASEGFSVSRESGLFLNNDNVFEGSEAIKDNTDGAIYDGEWSDLIEHIVRMSGVFEIVTNEDTNEAKLDTSYLIGYTVKVPKEGEDYMTTGPKSRRDQSGREFRISTIDITQNMTMSSDLLFYFRHGDLAASSVRGMYLNRLDNLIKPYIASHLSLERCKYYSETDVVSPLIMKESAGAHILHEYIDCVYLPSAFGTLFTKNKSEVDMQVLKDYVVTPGRAVDTSYSDTFKFDSYFLTQYALQSLTASPNKQLSSRSYRSKELAELNGKTLELSVNVFTDDSGMVTFTRGDSFKDPGSDKRLVYISYSDSKLNGTVSSRNVVLETNGELLTESCFVLSPIIKTELRPIIGNSPVYYAANILRNLAFAASFRYYYDRDKYLGITTYEESVVTDLIKHVSDYLKRFVGSSHRAATIGFETGTLMKPIYDACDAFIASPGKRTAGDMFSAVDPVLSVFDRMDTLLHPCLPVTSRTDSTGKIDRFLGGGHMYDVSSITNVDIPAIDTWFKRNYYEHIQRSIKNTLDMLICFG